MNISIRTVLLLGVFGAGSMLVACGPFGDDPFEEGAGGEAGDPSQGTGGTTTAGTGSGAGPTSGGSAGTGAGGSSGTGHGGAGGAFAPRSGSFKMLVYSRTTGFRHESSIRTGKQMLAEIADEQGFEVTMTETNEDITLARLSKYEIVFFLNTTGDVFNATEQQAFETWMTTRNGAFAGVHSATDTEVSWPFYQEVTGQYYDLHGPAGTPGQVVIEDAGLQFPGLSDLPNPWPRVEEWYRFNSHEEWSTKPGFTILARLEANNHPVVWTREYANFRSFYTSLGHDGAVFDKDEGVKRLITGGILWAVRREHLFE